MFDAAIKQIFKLLAATLKQLVIENSLSSANVNFMLPFEASYFEANDFSRRETIQYRFKIY